MSNLFGLQESEGVTLFTTSIAVMVLIALLVVIVLQIRILREMRNQASNIQASRIQADASRQNTDEGTAVKVTNKSDVDEEIIAAITAALCAYTDLSSSEFKIKSINRVGGNESTWRKSGLL